MREAEIYIKTIKDRQNNIELGGCRLSTRGVLSLYPPPEGGGGV